MPAGDQTWISTSITNTGSDAILWNLCAEAAPVAGRFAEPWRPGHSLPSPAGEWKSFLLGAQGLADGNRSLLFLGAGHDGAASGCGDIGHEQQLGGGHSFEQRLWWDGLAFRRLTPPPTGWVDLVASFNYVRADQHLSPDLEHRRTADVHLQAFVSGLPDRLADPGEAIDVALADPQLTAVFSTSALGDANEGVVRFDVARMAYEIGLLVEGPDDIVHLVSVDARRLVSLGYVERRWDFDVDGSP
jgi:hypothetical protein